MKLYISHYLVMDKRIEYRFLSLKAIISDFFNNEVIGMIYFILACNVISAVTLCLK